MVGQRGERKHQMNVAQVASFAHLHWQLKAECRCDHFDRFLFSSLEYISSAWFNGCHLHNQWTNFNHRNSCKSSTSDPFEGANFWALFLVTWARELYQAKSLANDKQSLTPTEILSWVWDICYKYLTQQSRVFRPNTHTHTNRVQHLASRPLIGLSWTVNQRSTQETLISQWYLEVGCYNFVASSQLAAKLSSCSRERKLTVVDLKSQLATSISGTRKTEKVAPSWLSEHRNNRKKSAAAIGTSRRLASLSIMIVNGPLRLCNWTIFVI